MKDNNKFPVGTKTAARRLGKSESAVKQRCKKWNVERLNNESGPYLIDRNTFFRLEDDIKDKPGNPNFYK